MSENENLRNSHGYTNFTFFASIRETVESLPKKKGDELLRVVMIYGTSGEVIDCSPTVKSVFYSIKPNIDYTHRRQKKLTNFQYELHEERRQTGEPEPIPPEKPKQEYMPEEEMMKLFEED